MTSIPESNSPLPFVPPRLWIESDFDSQGHREFLWNGGEHIIVGREGTIIVADDDPTVHRALLHIWWNHHFWVMQNCGTRIPLTFSPILLSDKPHNPYKITLPPESYIVPVPPGAEATFETYRGMYSFHLGIKPEGEAKAPHLSKSDEITEKRGNFTAEQKKIMAAFIEPFYRNPAKPRPFDYRSVPHTEEVAAICGKNKKSIEDALDRIEKQLKKIEAPEFFMNIQNQKRPNLQRRHIVAEYAYNNRINLGLIL